MSPPPPVPPPAVPPPAVPPSPEPPASSGSRYGDWLVQNPWTQYSPVGQFLSFAHGMLLKSGTQLQNPTTHVHNHTMPFGLILSFPNERRATHRSIPHKYLLGMSWPRACRRSNERCGTPIESGESRGRRRGLAVILLRSAEWCCFSEPRVSVPFGLLAKRPNSRSLDLAASHDVGCCTESVGAQHDSSMPLG